MRGVKADGVDGVGVEKDRWDLLPTEPLRHIIRVFMFGAKEYGEWNWLHVKQWEDRYYSAAFRHLTSWRDGEKLDNKSSLPHLAHAAACLLIMLALDAKRGPKTRT